MVFRRWGSFSHRRVFSLDVRPHVPCHLIDILATGRRAAQLPLPGHGSIPADHTDGHVSARPPASASRHWDSLAPGKGQMCSPWPFMLHAGAEAVASTSARNISGRWVPGVSTTAPSFWFRIECGGRSSVRRQHRPRRFHVLGLSGSHQHAVQNFLGSPPGYLFSVPCQHLPEPGVMSRKRPPASEPTNPKHRTVHLARRFP